jgi:hypothetical protein
MAFGPSIDSIEPIHGQDRNTEPADLASSSLHSGSSCFAGGQEEMDTAHLPLLRSDCGVQTFILSQSTVAMRPIHAIPTGTFISL